jgi:hypothetical protein
MAYFLPQATFCLPDPAGHEAFYFQEKLTCLFSRGESGFLAGIGPERVN